MTTPDPYRGSIRMVDPQSFNRYSYVGNDPMNFVDPSGLSKWDDEIIGWFQTMGFDASVSGLNGPGLEHFGPHIPSNEYGNIHLSPEMQNAENDYLGRLQNEYDAIAATRALRANNPGLALAIMHRNPRLYFIAVVPPGVQRALALIDLLFGHAVADQVRFDYLMNLTGLAAYITHEDYNPDKRTFDVYFKPEVEKFLANSPYFKGPGIASLHLDVGIWDYRSDTDLTGVSIHVILGKPGEVHFDEYSPYQDLYGLIVHNIPIIGHRIKRIF